MSDRVREAFELYMLKDGAHCSVLRRTRSGAYALRTVRDEFATWTASRRATLDEVLEALRCELDRKAAVMDAGTRLGLERALDIVRALDALGEV